MIQFLDYDRRFLEKSWVWLNDPEIRQLTLTPDFSREEQEIYYQGLKNRFDYWIKGVAFDSVLIGVMGLKNITEYDAEYWGYIGEKQYWGKGLGKYLLQKAVEHCKSLNMKSVYLHVSSTNLRAIKLYTKFGFILTKNGDTETYTLDLQSLKK